MNLADNLKKLRKEHGLSQEDLADKLGVSRQSVSKWESNQAYPEMDKVIQICKLFNLNINDLLNEDINEVKEKKENSNKWNKYLDDFLNFITKTVKLFTALKFKDKIKLIIEELFYILLGLIIYNILGGILADTFSFIYNINGYNPLIFSILKCIYSILFIAIFLIVFIHIFKIRYLDYYKLVDKEKEEKNEEEIELEDKQIKEEKKETKIIIRDEKSSSYSFLNILANIVIFFIKFIIFFILLGCIAAFIGIVVCLVFTFLVSKNTTLFFGLFSGFLGASIIAGLLIYMMFYFLVNKSIKYKISGLLFLFSFILCGIGIGLSVISIKDLNIIGLEGDYVKKESITIPMQNDLYIEPDYTFTKKYVEEKRKDIYIETAIVDDEPITIEVGENSIRFTQANEDLFSSANNHDIELLKRVIKDINNKKVYKYMKNEIVIHASKENLEKLKKNRERIEEEKREQEKE